MGNGKTGRLLGRPIHKSFMLVVFLIFLFVYAITGVVKSLMPLVWIEALFALIFGQFHPAKGYFTTAITAISPFWSESGRDLTSRLRFPSKLNGDLRKMGVHMTAFKGHLPAYGDAVYEVLSAKDSGSFGKHETKTSGENIDGALRTPKIPNNIKSSIVNVPPTFKGIMTAFKGIFQRMATQFAKNSREKTSIRLFESLKNRRFETFLYYEAVHRVEDLRALWILKDSRPRKLAPTLYTQIDGKDGKDGICLGVYGLNQSFVVGGFWGWFYRGSSSTYAHMYPMADVIAKVGDVIVFKGPHSYYPNQVSSIQEDVVQFHDFVAWDTCNFTDPEKTSGLALREDLRLDGGFRFTLQPQHANKVLYFASSRNYMSTTVTSRYCVRGIKVKVIVNPRLELPIRFTDDANTADSETVLRIRNTMSQLSRLGVLTQMQLEQRIRSEGQSGLTDVRANGQGLKQYNDGSFSGGAIARIHNHADIIRTVGIGEIQAVLNGVEFQTRHNDYSLRMPHRTSSQYHSTEDIPLPDVPPEVLSKATVAEQVTEMQEWFRAFKNQDWRVRDYRNYFKPILCYLEGTWIKTTTDLTDPFLSERHKIDAKTWRELHDKLRFLANSGRKNLLENIAFLPNSVRDLYNDTWPVFANWEYRILCHPLKEDLPLQRFRVASDLHTQLYSSPVTRNELHTSRKARFELNTRTSGSNPFYPTINGNGQQQTISWSDGPRSWDYLDYLMEQIPGKGNYQVNLTDSLAGDKSPAHYYYPEKGMMNAGYYSRYYSVLEDDAMGTAKHRRGFHDAYLFAARTEQDRVSEVGYVEDFNVDPTCTSNCATYDVPLATKWSYAIPMEVIFLTPLSKWNPYNILEQPDQSTVTANSRTGACTSAAKAYDGYHLRKAFFTPASFFGSDAAAGGGDTSGGETCVLDQGGTMRYMRASGHWITFPRIGGGVGEVRQRFPIMPIHEMGSTSYKELKALQELTLSSVYDSDPAGYFGHSRDERFGFTVEIIGGGHQHFIRISPSKLTGWKNPDGSYDETGTLTVTADSDIRNGHEHTLQFTRIYANNVWTYQIKQCKYVGAADGTYTANSCSDGHSQAERST